MRRVITVAEIYTAPVKSLALQRRKAVQVGPRGIPEDRRFYLIDARGRLLTQRELGKLTQIKASFDVASGQLELDFPDGPALSAKVELGQAVTTRIWGRLVQGNVLRGDWGTALSQFCGEPVMLVAAESPGQCYDEFPVSLLSRAALQRLEQQAEKLVEEPAERPGEISGEFDACRFRPTFLLENCEPHEEDSWIGRTLGIGEHLKIQVISRDPRCAVISQNPATGEQDVDTLSLIRSYRRESAAAYFGVYAVVLHPGAVAAGDEIRLLKNELTLD